MDLVAEQRVLLGLDVIGSASAPGAELNRVAGAWQTILHDALRAGGIGASDVLASEAQGDGAVLTLPYPLLGKVVDLAQRLHERAAAHNRTSRPEIRLRIAVHAGPLPEHGYARTRIDHARLLDAPVLKELLARCHETADDGAHTGLVLSDQVFRSVFGGDHTELVRSTEFAELAVSAKEFRTNAWVRVPGFDARSLAALSTPGRKTAEPDAAGVHNQVNGVMNGVQAGTVHGGITFGAGGR
jgi:hypothetical protein